MEFTFKKKKISKKPVKELKLSKEGKKQLEQKKPISIDDVIKKHMTNKKVKKIKQIKKEELKEIVQPYKPIPLTESSYFVFMKQLDYNRLYSYLGKLKTTTAQSFEYDDIAEQTAKTSQDVFTYKELSNYLRKFTINNLIGTQMNDFSIKEKEQFNNYAMFNKEKIMLETQTNLRGITQTDIPAPMYSKEKDFNKEKVETQTNRGIAQTDNPMYSKEKA